MIRPVPLTVFVVYGEPEMGVWCDGCSLPSKTVWPATLLTIKGVTSGATAERCLNGCQRKDNNA